MFVLGLDIINLYKRMKKRKLEKEGYHSTEIYATSEAYSNYKRRKLQLKTQGS